MEAGKKEFLKSSYTIETTQNIGSSKPLQEF
jgi:hypothetical protein